MDIRLASVENPEASRDAMLVGEFWEPDVLQVSKPSATCHVLDYNYNLSIHTLQMPKSSRSCFETAIFQLWEWTFGLQA